MRLRDKVAFITGAASGMGRVGCERFAREGASIVASDVSEEGLAEVVSSIRERGGHAVGAVGDVSNACDVQSAVELGLKTYSRLDVLYNNAGIMPDEDRSVTETEEEVWERVQNVNLKGIYLGCRYAIPAMIEGGGGSIINVASFVAILGCTVPQDAYTASKGGVLSLTRSLAVQYGPKGVRANALCPGPIDTPLLQELFKDKAARDLRLNRIPLGRLGTPEDIVNAALFLASDESAWMTGTSFVVDGGITVNYF